MVNKIKGLSRQTDTGNSWGDFDIMVTWGEVIRSEERMG